MPRSTLLALHVSLLFSAPRQRCAPCPSDVRSSGGSTHVGLRESGYVGSRDGDSRRRSGRGVLAASARHARNDAPRCSASGASAQRREQVDARLEIFAGHYRYRTLWQLRRSTRLRYLSFFAIAAIAAAAP